MNEVAQILEGYSANALKAMASARVQDAKGTKAQLVHNLAKVLWDPKQVEIFLQALTPVQQAVLQRAKQYGGLSLRPDLIEAQVEADGFHGARAAINSMLRLGFLVYEQRGPNLWELWPTQSYSYYYYTEPTLRLAPPVAERVEVSPDLGRLSLTPWAESPDRVVEGSFSTLQRDLYHFLQYLRESRVKLLKSGLLSKRDFTRLNQLMSEPEDLTDVTTFDETFRLQFLYLLLHYAGLMAVGESELRATPQAESFFQQSEAAQLQALLKAWVRMAEWNEFFFIPWIEAFSFASFGNRSDVPEHDRLPPARQDLLDLLDREKPHGEWFTLPSLFASMQRYKLGFLIPNRGQTSSYYHANRKDDTPLYEGFYPRGRPRHNERYSKKEHWALVEGGFLVMVLQLSLRWLGVVRLAVKGEEITAFQVTDLGAAALGWIEASTLGSAAPARTLIVQPNFEIVVMLESAGFGLLAELDRFAERVKVDKAALYRLTRASVCRGLQSGLTRDQIEETLRERSGMPLPQNVAFTLREWEELFNRIHVQKRIIVVEAETEGELEKRLEELQLTEARRIGPTAAVIDTAGARKLVAWGRGPRRRVQIHDFTQTTADTFRFADAREIEVRPGLGSPLLEHRLARVAVPMKNGRFLLEPERVRAAANALGVDGVERFLEEGSGKALLPDTRLMVEGWAGKLPALGFGKLTALTAPRSEILDAILKVPELARHARRLAPTVALIPEKAAPELQKALAARGLQLAPGADLDAALASRAEPEEISLLFVRPKRRREIIDEAIAEQKRLNLGFQNWNSTRLLIHEVDPIKVLESGGSGTLVAYSHREHYQMQFNIQQIQGIRKLEKPIDEKDHK